jgi:hypothetical protein
MSRFLACLFAWVTRVFSPVARTTSRRGKPKVTVALDDALMRQLAEDYQRKAERWVPSSGSSLRSARTAPRRTAGTTAVTTTTATGGSRGAASAVGDFGMCIYPQKRKTRPDPPGS